MRVEDMTPKQINNYPGFTTRLNRIISGAMAAIKNADCRIEYLPINYEDNPGQIITRIIIYSGQRQFAVVTARKTQEGKYEIKYTPTGPQKKKANFTVADAKVAQEEKQ